MNFENEQIFPEDLPKLSQVDLYLLEKSYLKVLYLGRSIFALIFILIPLILYFTLQVDWSLWLVAMIFLLWSLIMLLPVMFTRKVYLRKKYALRQKDIIYEQGFIFQQKTVIPFNRIQHIELKHGPLDRRFGLCNLKIYTAGGSQSDLSIPGLNQKRAESIKEFIIGKNVSDEEE